MKLKLLLTAMSAAVCAFGQADYFPLQVGNQWIYRNPYGVQTVEITRSQVIDGREYFFLRGAFGGDALFTPAIAKASAQLGMTGKICAYGFDLGPAQLDALRSGDLTGVIGQQPFLQGFWPVMQLYLQIDRGISAANLDTRAQLVTKQDVGNIGKRYEN